MRHREVHIQQPNLSTNNNIQLPANTQSKNESHTKSG
jgi:hypothetical protein